MIKGLVCILAVLATAQAFNPSDVGHLLEWFIEGAFGEDIPSLPTCITDGEDIFHLFEQVVHDCKEHSA
jgi:hypothetical protein